MTTDPWLEPYTPAVVAAASTNLFAGEGPIDFGPFLSSAPPMPEGWTLTHYSGRFVAIKDPK